MLGRLRLLSLHRVSHNFVPGPASNVDYGRELSLPVEPAALEQVSICGVGSALNRSAARACNIDSFSTLLSFHDAELHCLAFSCTPLDLLWLVPSDRCLTNKDILAGVFDCAMTSDEAITV